jgi:triosephosphate isomerase
MTSKHTPASVRTPLIAGNWKMNMDHVQGPELLEQLAEALQRENHDPAEVEVAVFPPFTSLSNVQDRCQKSGLPIACGGQDLSPHDSGAYTGDTSGQFLARLGCTYVLVGHSERRMVHNESDNIMRDKVQAAYRHQLVPVLCVGEDLAIRRADKHVQHTLGQLRTALQGLTEEQLEVLVVAYEPVWAIGTGEVAGPRDAQEMCDALRGEITNMFSAEVAAGVRLLYGGSVKGSNAGDILKQSDVDGVLVGGASLNAAEFASIAVSVRAPAL